MGSVTENGMDKCLTSPGEKKTPDVKTNKGCVDKKLIPVKILLMTFYGALGCLLPFLTLHMKHIGLSHADITWINAALPITSVFGPPLACIIADRLDKHKVITILSMMLAAIFHLLLLYVPATVRQGPAVPPLQLWCDDGGSHLAVLPCDSKSYENPCLQYNETKDMISKFRLENCRYFCSNGSTAFLQEDRQQSSGELSDGPDSSPQLVAINELSYVPPATEIRAPSRPPHICLLPASNVEKCITMTEKDTFSFNRSLKLHEAVLASEGALKSCHFKQEQLSTVDKRAEGHLYYEGIVCHPDPECKVVCDAQETMDGKKFLQGKECENIEGNAYVTFWVYFVIRALADLFPAILVALLDAMTLSLLDAESGDFGRQKMFGLVSVGVTAPLVGLMMDDSAAVPGDLTYAPVFYAFVALMIVSIVITLLIPFNTNTSADDVWRSMVKLVNQQELIALFVIMAMLGSFWNYLETFLYIYLASMQAPKLLLGLTVTIGIIPSIPFMFKSDKIIDICGHHNLLILAFIMYGIRFSGFAFMTDPWWCMPLEALELFTLNLAQVVAATLAFKIAPRKLVATAQALVWIAHFTIGRCIGAFVSGLFIKLYGMKVVFCGAAGLAIICAIIYCLCYYCLKYSSKRRTGRPHTRSPPSSPQRPMLQNANGNMSNGTYRQIPLTENI